MCDCDCLNKIHKSAFAYSSVEMVRHLQEWKMVLEEAFFFYMTSVAFNMITWNEITLICQSI